MKKLVIILIILGFVMVKYVLPKADDYFFDSYYDEYGDVHQESDEQDSLWDKFKDKLDDWFGKKEEKYIYK